MSISKVGKEVKASIREERGSSSTYLLSLTITIPVHGHHYNEEGQLSSLLICGYQGTSSSEYTVVQ
jgi:hypothetical protein